MIHAPLRLRICGLLRSVDRLDFAVMRDTIDVSDSTLSKHLRLLSDAGFVVMKKSASPMRTDSRRITWVSLTSSGKRAFDGHLEALRSIAAGFVPAGSHTTRTAAAVGDEKPASAGSDSDAERARERRPSSRPRPGPLRPSSP
ncbi:transcriptional regulator [Corynebacterium hylobatis]|nr:transcriptional regulator [Corynebacterium hylobatis]